MDLDRCMVADWDEHELTIVAWPTRESVWRPWLGMAEDEYAKLVALISRYEPVLVVCRAGQQARIESLLGSQSSLGPFPVDFLVHPIDDGWIRDNGPIGLRTSSGVRLVNFAFNSWGSRFSPFEGDATASRSIARRLDLELDDVPFVLEGGALSVNGAGTALVVEECVIHPSRNGYVSKAHFEDVLSSRLGVRDVIWLPFGLREDLKNTDGHVDNVAVFVGQASVLAQQVDSGNENFGRLAANATVLNNARLSDGSRLSVSYIPVLPYAQMPNGSRQPSPYVNCVFLNGAVVVPVVDKRDIPFVLDHFGGLFPDRDVCPTDSLALVHGGGGPHCVTMHIPKV